jgi:isopenicillin N synthase-like dioxygenase
VRERRQRTRAALSPISPISPVTPGVEEPLTLDVPVIDISGFHGGSKEVREAIAQQVDRAAREVGFMQISGHGIEAPIIDGLTDAIDGFFAQPMTAKLPWCPPAVDVNRGYTAPRSERLSYSLGVASAADLFEAFNVGAQRSDFPELDLPSSSYPENIWPDQPPEFQDQIETWFWRAGRLARTMTRIFELALDLPPRYFSPFQDHSVDVLRLNNYAMPEHEVRLESGQMGMGAHTDFGIVTILWADRVFPGLQILDSGGIWHDVAPVPGALLINLGDMLARWTNDRWLSTMHRVLPSVDASGRVLRRRSAAFFHDGNYDAVISCLPGCADAAHPARYPAVTVAEHIAAKLAGSRGLKLNEDGSREAARLPESERR